MTDTHTVTTTITDADALALPAGVAPGSVRVGGAAVAAGVLEVPIAGAEL